MEVKDTSDRGLRGASLAGREVSITGRLASMSRDEALRRIEAAGGRFVALPGPGTAFLFVGEDGPPLGEDGRLTAPLQRARELQREGAALAILPEEALLSSLGATEDSTGVQRLFTTAQLARILEEKPRRLRAWMRHGLITPVKSVRRLLFFDFPQVATARALARLTALGVTPARMRRSLEELAEWIPGATASLVQLETLERGGPLLLRTTEGDLAETTGQLRLDFEEDASPDAEAALETTTSCDDWFQRGILLEDTERLDEAVRAYARALEPEAPRAEIAFNLGNCLHALERFEEASQALALATEVDPEYVEAWNNLGIVLGDLEREEDATVALERALAIEPDYADAHFNLGESLAAQGRIDEARAHWSAYLALDPHSGWADEVRARLRRTL